MTDVYVDDRPIKPNKEYLEQKEQEHKQRKQFHEFLKKHQFNDQVLPCFRENIKHTKTKKQHSPSPQQRKTKAQIYEEIKRINIEKFGDKKDRQKQKENEPKNKKINPLQMTINYKPKSAIIINTNEYKLKSPNQQDQNTKQELKNKTQLSPGKYDQTAKQKYEKLLNIMRKQRIELTKEKEDFEKHKEKLQFKKFIQGEDSVPFIVEIKKEIQEKNKLKQSHRVQCKARKDDKENSNNTKSQENQNNKNNQNGKKQKDLTKIQSRISQLQQQKQEIQDQVYKNKRNLLDPDDVVSTKYSLQQINHIPAFDVQCFKDFIDIKTLHPHGNQFYQIALKVFETGLNVKQAKMKLRIQNLDRVKENCQDGLNSVDYKRKYQGQTRITKYNNGWIEVWTPGTQRVMTNKELCYKVIWLKNGDIRQEWKDKKFESYYSKAKEVVQLKFDKFEPIYYFVQLNQIEQYNPQKKIKTVMFRQGRIQTFSTEEDTMNGFAI